MRTTYRIGALALVLILCDPHSSIAQDIDVRFEHLTTAEGLASNSVRTIFQDTQGFMWFGTSEGLHRYDGYDFTIYRQDENDPHSLSHDDITAIEEDREGILWIGTSRGGLNRFDPATEIFTHYRYDEDDPHSLSFDFVTAILEDRKGLLWIGTRDGGLNRFDRETESFTHYHHDPEDPTSLGWYGAFFSDYGMKIYEDQEGVLWIKTGVLNRFDRTSDSFTRYPVQDSTYHPEIFRQIRSLSRDGRRLASILKVGNNQELTRSMTLTEQTTALVVSMGEANVGTRNARRWKFSGNLDYGTVENGRGDVVWRVEPERARHAGGGPNNSIQIEMVSLVPDTYTIGYLSDSAHSYGNWLFGTPSHPELWGIQLLRLTDAEARYIATYLNRDERPNSALSGDVGSICEDQDGILWVGTTGGLNRFDRETETFVSYRYNPEDSGSLSSDIVQVVREDLDGVLWIGTKVGGLNRFDREANSFTRFPNDPSNPDGFFGSSVRDIYVDRAGAIWIATNEGINRLDPSANKFTIFRSAEDNENSLSHNNVRAVHETRDGTLWIGTDAGLDHFDPVSRRFTHYAPERDDPINLPPGVSALFEDSEGMLWVGMLQGGLNRLDRETGTFTHYRHNAEDSTSLGGIRITSIYEDRDEVLWVGTGNHFWGLNRFNPGTQSFTRYRHDPNDSTSISGYGSRGPIYEDSGGALWIDAVYGASHSLNRLDRNTGRFRRFVLDPERPEHSAAAIHEDDAGRLWIGTSLLFHGAGQGALFLFDPHTEAVVPFTGQENLPQDNVTGIAGDEAGTLWISTANTGIVRFNPKTGDVRTYDLADGLPSLRFNPTAYFQSPSGEIFFGSDTGLVAFTPERTLDNPYVPPVVLTDVKVQNKPVPIGEDAPLKVPISKAEAITLAYDHKDFIFTFAALNYNQTQKNRYAYRLEGYEDDWIEAGLIRQARYTNVTPGTYVFHVRGSDNDGVWNEEGATIRVRVLPAFWQTWWFRFFALLTVVGTAYVGYRARVRSLEMRTRNLETEVQERTTEVRAQAEKLLELDRIKSHFFANISHEFRTPLTLLLGPLGDALERKQDLPLSQLPVLHRNARRLLRLINQLLDLSKLEAGSMTLRARRAAFLPFFKATVQAFSSTARRQQITLRTEVPEDDIELYYEPDKLEKVLFNLLSNAFKYTPEGGTIVAGVEEGTDELGAFIEITVRDSGPGIPAQDLTYIFDRFRQVNDFSTRSREGTGIGLALVKELVALHGGSVRVKSELGFGATFFVRLPKGRAHLHDDEIADEDFTQEELSSSRLDLGLRAIDEVVETEKHLHKERDSGETATAPARDLSTILIVEDNADVRSYLKSHLDADYTIEEAADGIDGLEKAHLIDPDLIISDVMMPKMDGYELCKALKADETLNHIPVVLLTAKADEASKIEGLEVGADDYLYKPFDADELLVRVENLIEIRRQLRAHYSKTVFVMPSEIEVTSAEAILLEHAREIVENHLGNSIFSTEMMADEIGLSRRQLDRKLKALTRLSASGYIRKMRLERAAQLLEQHGGNVSEVAHKVGFHDAKHFSRLFQQTFGTPPSKWVRPCSEA